MFQFFKEEKKQYDDCITRNSSDLRGQGFLTKSGWRMLAQPTCRFRSATFDELLPRVSIVIPPAPAAAAHTQAGYSSVLETLRDRCVLATCVTAWQQLTNRVQDERCNLQIQSFQTYARNCTSTIPTCGRLRSTNQAYDLDLGRTLTNVSFIV